MTNQFNSAVPVVKQGSFHQETTPRQSLKSLVLAICLSILPALGSGATSYYFVNKAIAQYIAPTESSKPSIPAALQQKLLLELTFMSAVTALLSSAIALRAARSTIAFLGSRRFNLRSSKPPYSEQLLLFGDIASQSQPFDLKYLYERTVDGAREILHTDRVIIYTFSKMALGIRQSLNSKDIFSTLVGEILNTLEADRVLIYQFNPDGKSGEITAQAIAPVADVAFKQAQETTRALDSVGQMTHSIKEVANSAHHAAAVARTASETAEASTEAMEHTAQKIMNLRETVREMAKQVKCLGESSQEISKVVSLINQIALQTNLLALNAGIKAARAGEEGQSFAVVAKEVSALAARSSEATKEIEQIVETIQRETSQAVEAMERGTIQVVEGSQLVEDTKHSLGHILEVSRQIDQLVQSISSATVSQVETSCILTDSIKEMAKVSEWTSNSSHQISSSLQKTVDIAQQLQSSVGVFKVDPTNN